MSEQPSQSEQLAKGQQVAQAGAAAAAEAPPEQAQAAASKAMRKERDRLGFEQLPDAEIDRIASALSPKLIEGFREHGAFDAPPEPVAPPSNVAPPAPGGDEAAAPAAGEPAPAPVRRTFADRFLGS
jgi:hypothetical protein